MNDDFFLDNCIGLRLMKWLMKSAENSIAKEFNHIFKSTVTYNVNVNRSNVLPLPRSVTVEGSFNINYIMRIRFNLNLIFFIFHLIFQIIKIKMIKLI